MLLGSKQMCPGLIIADSDLCARLIDRGMYAEAYSLLGDCADPAACYNRALCLYHGNRFGQALELVEQLLAQADPSGPPAAADEGFAAISRAQAGQRTFLRPVDTEYPGLLPSFFRDNLARFRVELLLRMEKWNEVVRAAAPLQGRNFPDIDAALGRAREEIR